MRGLFFLDRSQSAEKKAASTRKAEKPSEKADNKEPKSSKKMIFSSYLNSLRVRTSGTDNSLKTGNTPSAGEALGGSSSKVSSKHHGTSQSHNGDNQDAHKGIKVRTVPQPDNAPGHFNTLKRPIAHNDSEMDVDMDDKQDRVAKLDRSNFIVENTGKVTDFYNVESKVLGTGTYGSVCRATRIETGKVRALKAISKTQVKNMDKFRREIDIMKCLDHPNVLKLFETFEDHRNIYLVLELCEGGELFDRIISEGHFTEKHAAVLMKQIFSAVNYLHQNKIMHRDLKPENFLFLNTTFDSPLKIIDFGLSCTFEEGQYVSTKAGTPYYVAPQVLDGRYDYRCDAWSLGVILYILLCGYPPFYGDTDAEVLEKVKTGCFSFSGSEWRRVSSEAKDLITRLLKLDPDERLSVEAALNHTWITSLAQNADNVELPTTIMANLRGFRAQNKLKKAALTVIAQNMSESEIENLRNIFISLDVDNSGTLSVQEISEGLARLGWKEIPPDLQQIIKDVDSDRSGNIDYTEFIAATMDRKLYMQEDLCWAAFRVFDLDGNGKISQDELRHILGMPDVADAVGQETIKALLSEVDLDGDGEIDFEEFMHMMRQKHPMEAVVNRRAPR